MTAAEREEVERIAHHQALVVFWIVMLVVCVSGVLASLTLADHENQISALEVQVRELKEEKR